MPLVEREIAVQEDQYLYEDLGVNGPDGQPAATRVLTIMLADEW